MGIRSVMIFLPFPACAIEGLVRIFSGDCVWWDLGMKVEVPVFDGCVVRIALISRKDGRPRTARVSDSRIVSGFGCEDRGGVRFDSNFARGFGCGSNRR